MTKPATERRVGSLLVVGPGERGRGGIAAVIEMHRQSRVWQRRGGVHLSTYDDRSGWRKAWAALQAYLLAPRLILAAEVVHVHLAAQTSLLRKVPIVAMARLLRRPVIVHLHAASEEALFGRTPRIAVRFVFLSAARVVALSQSWADVILKHLPSARVTIIPNPVLTVDPGQRPQGSKRVVLLVGKLEARKGYGDLLAAAAVVVREFADTEFWFAGHGEVETARALAKELGIEHAVRLLGWVDRAQLTAIYGEAAVLALPSYGEGVPMSVIEAMSRGVPVVCTPVGGVPEWIETGRNGLLVAPGDVADLAKQILRLLRDPAFAEALGEAGRRTVQQRCTLGMVSDRLDALYSETIETRCGSPCFLVPNRSTRTKL